MPDPGVFARELAAAIERRTPIERLTARHADLDLDTAYTVQALGVQDRLAGGERLTGLKLGLTSRAKQETMGVDTPIYGRLTSGMLLDAAEPISLDRYIHVRAEPEIAFLLGRELAGPASIVDVLAATDAVCAAVELIDSRYANFSFELPDVAADNASAAGYLVGPRLRPHDQLPDLRLLGCVLRVDGEIAHTAAGAAVMGHPAAPIAWLATQLARKGQTIPGGTLILSGALTDAVPLHPGTTISAEIQELGSIEIHA
jgi:2-oxo-3-hexenedioate decarboxylase